MNNDSPSFADRSGSRPAGGVPGPPQRPPRWEERIANRLFHALAPRVRRTVAEPPASLEPYESFTVRRSRARGHLAATWFPVDGPARSAVLLVHPHTPWGQAYFHRRRRIEALRDAGHHVMTFDMGGYGGSGPVPADFQDVDVEDALDALAERAAGLTLHLWGVSAGGYWAHPVLARRDDVRGAFFEDVACHLIQWSKRMAPWGLPAYLTFEHVTRRAWRFLDLRRHAPHLRVRAVAYAGGEIDRGVPAAETRELARLAGAECLTIPGAGHLDAIRDGGDEVRGLALETFTRAT